MGKGAENTMFTKFNTMVAGGALALGLALSATGANAALVVNSSVGGAPNLPGIVTYVNFDNLTPGTAVDGSTSGGITLTFNGNSQVASVPNQPGTFAAPVLSGGNGLNFGSPNQANGQDTTPYLSTGTSSIEMVFGGLQSFFGMLWGSVDTYNTLQFFDGATLVGTLTGSQVIGVASGDQTADGTVYINVNSTLQFDRVVASSTSFAFEFDNVAYAATRTDVPAPGALALLGLGLVGIGAVSRRRKAA